MKVDIAIRIRDLEGDTVTHALTDQPSVAEAVGYTLRALNDYIPRMDECVADIVELVEEQFDVDGYSFFQSHFELRDQLAKAAEGIRDGWAEHDAKVNGTAVSQ